MSSLIVLFSIIIGAISLYLGIVLVCEDWFKAGISLLVIIISVGVSLIYNYDDLPRDTYHEVNISELAEFDYEKYEIISQKGKIITIKEVK